MSIVSLIEGRNPEELGTIAKIASAAGLFTYLDFPICMWKAIRTTNYIESFNADLQRYSNHRILFNSEPNEIIVLTVCLRITTIRQRRKRRNT